MQVTVIICCVRLKLQNLSLSRLQHQRVHVYVFGHVRDIPAPPSTPTYQPGRPLKPNHVNTTYSPQTHCSQQGK